MIFGFESFILKISYQIMRSLLSIIRFANGFLQIQHVLYHNDIFTAYFAFELGKSHYL